MRSRANRRKIAACSLLCWRCVGDCPDDSGE